MPGASAPPVERHGRPRNGLRVARVVARDFDGHSETSLDPDLRVFVSDLARPYGLELREDLLRRGVGHSYGEMAEELLAQALPAGEPVDLLILAFSSPDVRPGRSAAVHLSRFCPGAPLAFAVCDQGPAAAFTALRIASDYSRSGACRRAVVLAVEQTSLHHRPAAPVVLPDRHRAVALVCEQTDGDEALVRQSSGAVADSAPAQVRSEWAALGPQAALISGPELALGPQAALSGPEPEREAGLGRDPLGPVVEAGPGQPFTGVWTQLAERLPAWRAERRPVLVADLDRRLGRLSTLALPAGVAP
ncbi:hypothetical protein [Kitasatospora sp. NPDC057223]|uniref:hypothetical protein n=1 Tax=Kitasatospora sp. NPDC057223 TaxID=3346055 RepID=UPI00364214B3